MSECARLPVKKVRVSLMSARVRLPVKSKGKFDVCTFEITCKK